MHIVAIQPDIAWEDPAATFEHVRAMVHAHQKTAPIPPGSLVVLPEMFATGFSMNVDITVQGDSREGETFLRQLAQSLQSTVIGGVVNCAADICRGFNQAVAFGAEGSELLRYTKIHPFGYAGEPEHYDAGRSVEMFDVREPGADINAAASTWRVAPLVCYDLRFPEVFRLAAAGGATLLVVIANWPASRIDHWETLLRARAIENQACVVGVNRTGSDPIARYDGRSAILNAKGHALAVADERTGVITADVDLAEVMRYRAKFSALADMKYRWDEEGFRPKH
jgi:predicted amidohydrolase